MNGKDYSSRAERELEDIEKQIEEITKASLKGKDKLNSESMVGEDELSQAIDLSTMIFSKKEGDKENLTSSTTEFKLSRLQNQINTECAAVLSSILPRIHIRSKVYTESILQVPQEATLRIIRYLSAQDLIQLSQVSKEFSKAGKLNKYLIIEQRYAAELRKLVYDYTLTPCFEIGTNLIKTYKELGDLYIDIGRVSNKAEDYTDAAVFYQYVLSMVERLKEEQKAKTNQELENYKVQAFEQLDIIWRELRELVYISTNREITSRLGLVKHESEINRDFLKKLRMDTENKIQEIDEDSLKKEETESVYESEEYFINESRGLFEYIAKEVKGFIARIFKECEEVIGEPPCKYNAIGLGSLSLNQFTPYSDLEFAILTENEEYKHNSDPKVQNYFKNLSHLVHFKVICLGETIIPTSKYSINLESFVCRGFNFDLGGKTPLGRIEKDKPYELIQTTGKMARYLDEKYSHVDKNLPYILEASCFIYGEKELFANFRKKVTNFLNIKNENGIPNYEVRTLKRLKEGVTEYNYNSNPGKPKSISYKGDIDNFRPSLIGTDEGKLLDVKQEIYRLPDRLLYSLALNFGIEAESAWDAVDKLHEKNVIGSIEQKKYAPHNLKFATSFATMLRLRTYCANRGQFDSILLFQLEHNNSEEINHLTKYFNLPAEELTEKGSLFKYYYIAIPLHKIVEEFCTQQNAISVNAKNTFFYNEGFYSNKFLYKGIIYLRTLQYEKALSAFKEGIKEEPQNFLVLTQLGYVLYMQGKYEEALRCYKQSLLIVERIYGMRHSIYINILGSYIIPVLVAQGKNKEALKYHKQVLDAIKDIYNNENPEDYTAYLNNIAIVLYNLGKYKEALKYFDLILDIKKKIYNPEHPEYAISLNNMAALLYDMGQFTQAFKLHKQALVIRGNTYGKDHPDYVGSLNNIALVLNELGQYAEALKYYEQGLVTIKRVYGKDNQAYANITNNMAIVFYHQGDYNKALQYYHNALSIRKNIYGKNHPDYTDSLCNIAIVLRDIGEHKQALKYYQEALSIRENAYGKNHPDYGTLLSLIALVLNMQGKHYKALNYCNEALSIIQNKCGKNHSYATCLNNTATILHSIGEYENALEHYKQSSEILDSIYGKEHHLYAISLNNIATVLQRMGQYKNALEYYNQSSGIFKKLLGKEHFYYINSLNNLSTVLQNLWKFKKALKKQLEALNILENTPQVGINMYGVLLLNISNNLRNLGHYQEALDFVKQSSNIVLPEHDYMEIATETSVKCTIALANQKILFDHRDEALPLYFSIGIEEENLAQALREFADYYLYNKNDLNLALSCYKVLNEKLLPNSREIKYKLAHTYDMKAMVLKEVNNIEKSKKCLNKARLLFNLALNLESEEVINLSIYIEYAMFLIKYHNANNREEYTKIKELLNKAIELQNDCSSLVYDQVEKLTVVEPLQELLNSCDSITVVPNILIYYLLIKAHNLYERKEEAAKVLKEFATDVMSIKQEEAEVPLNLLITAYKELGFEFQAKIYQEILVRVLSTKQGIEYINK
ncbi:tetratricopeptide repeat protein [Candidatus Jidaibacter acanthamoebae]|nr:tetratricopeptide repeat protein [Candidatus Jidaibacter acanthamoeba]